MKITGKEILDRIDGDVDKSTIYILSEPLTKSKIVMDMLNNKMKHTHEIHDTDLISSLLNNKSYKAVQQNLSIMYRGLTDKIEIELYVKPDFYKYTSDNILDNILLKQINIGDNITIYPDITDISIGQPLYNFKSRPIIGSLRYESLTNDKIFENYYSEDFDIIIVG